MRSGRLLTFAEVAEELRCSHRTVVREVVAGKLAETVVGRKRFVLRSEVEGYIRRQTTRHAPPPEPRAPEPTPWMRRAGVENLDDLFTKSRRP